jgi:malonyl-CoA decarboxylase
MNKIGRFTKNIIESIADAGEKFLDLAYLRGTPVQELLELSYDLISHKGLASGIALARQVVSHYNQLGKNEKLEYFLELIKITEVDIREIKARAEELYKNPGPETREKLNKSLKTKCQKLFSRMNMAPNGTKAIVQLREDLLEFLPKYPQLKPLDVDLRTLLTTWFNPGFLVLKKIDWETEAAVLEKIIQYETVHHIGNWNDLKQRLVNNRRCFAYFHPALDDDPLIFVEVALTRKIAASVQAILNDNQNDVKRDTAIFYSINNCQRGLKRIPLGNFLIKMVATEIARENPNIKTFSSLSPVTGFARWLKAELKSKKSMLFGNDRDVLKQALNPGWHKDTRLVKKIKKPLMRACAHYLVNEKRGDKPLNSVARFHFGNGAELYRINWMGNSSKHGIDDSFGIMVNYLYDLKNIESNHEDYMINGGLAVSRSVRKLLE